MPRMTAPNIYDNRACRITVNRMTELVRLVSDTWDNIGQQWRDSRRLLRQAVVHRPGRSTVTRAAAVPAALLASALSFITNGPFAIMGPSGL